MKGDVAVDDEMSRCVRALDEALLRACLPDLGHPDYRRRKKAARRLGDLGPTASEAVPSLVALCRDGHPAVRAAAQAALSKIRPSPPLACPGSSPEGS